METSGPPGHTPTPSNGQRPGRRPRSPNHHQTVDPGLVLICPRWALRREDGILVELDFNDILIALKDRHRRGEMSDDAYLAARTAALGEHNSGQTKTPTISRLITPAPPPPRATRPAPQRTHLGDPMDETNVAPDTGITPSPNGLAVSTVPPTKVCAKCSVQSHTVGDFCPNCGGSYIAKRRRRPGKKALATLLVALLIGGVSAGVLVNKQHDDEVKAKKVAATAVLKKAADAKALADTATAAKGVADTAERAKRADDVKQLETAIFDDATKRVKTDPLLITGPILRANCTPLGGGSTDDLTALTGTFECIAVNKVEGTQESGYAFNGTINYNTGEMQWRLGH